MCVLRPKTWSTKGLQQEGLQRPPSGHRPALSPGGGAELLGQGGGVKKQKYGRYRNRRTGPITNFTDGKETVESREKDTDGTETADLCGPYFFLGGPCRFFASTHAGKSPRGSLACYGSQLQGMSFYHEVLVAKLHFLWTKLLWTPAPYLKNLSELISVIHCRAVTKIYLSGIDIGYVIIWFVILPLSLDWPLLPASLQTITTLSKKNRITERNVLRIYHSVQNHYTHENAIFKLFRGLQLQLSGVLRINYHCTYSFLVFF